MSIISVCKHRMKLSLKYKLNFGLSWMECVGRHPGIWESQESGEGRPWTPRNTRAIIRHDRQIPDSHPVYHPVINSNFYKIVFVYFLNLFCTLTWSIAGAHVWLERFFFYLCSSFVNWNTESVKKCVNSNVTLNNANIDTHSSRVHLYK